MASDIADDELLAIADREDTAEARYVISAAARSLFTRSPTFPTSF